jgi:hypothetical protein
MEMLTDWRQVVSFLGAMCAFGGALVASFIALVTQANLCEGCRHPSPILDLQLMVALVGLAPAATLLYATARWRPRLAAWALASGVVTYALWGLMNNVAVHGSLFGG